MSADSIVVDMQATYDQWLELEALVLTAEYCALHGITDPLRVRQVHYLALSIVVGGSDA